MNEDARARRLRTPGGGGGMGALQGAGGLKVLISRNDTCICLRFGVGVGVGEGGLFLHSNTICPL